MRPWDLASPCSTGLLQEEKSLMVLVQIEPTTETNDSKPLHIIKDETYRQMKYHTISWYACIKNGRREREYLPIGRNREPDAFNFIKAAFIT